MAWPTNFSRAVFFFRSPEGEGFSEEYLWGSELELSDFQAAIAAMVPVRMALLSDKFTLVYIRMNYPHDSRTLLPPPPTIAIPVSGTQSDEDYQRCEVGALVTFFTESGRYAERIFRGVPDSAIDIDGRLNFGHTYTDNLRTWIELLMADPVVGLVNIKATKMAAAYTFAAYNNYAYGRTTTRDSGRPFGLRRGRG